MGRNVQGARLVLLISRFFSLVVLGLGALIVVCGTSSRAYAHGSYPAASQLIFDPQNASHYMVRTSIGILRTEDAGQSWRWICLPAYGAQSIEDPYLAIDDWNTIFVGRQQGLSISHDGGCSWESHATFVDQRVQQVERSPDGKRMYVLTSSWNAPNGVYVSEDHGVTFNLLGETHAKMLLSKLLISAADESKLYVAGIEVTSSGAMIPKTVVYYSADAGKTWETVPFVLGQSETSFNLLGIDPSNADRVYGTTVSNKVIRVLKSDDGARSFREVFRNPEGISSFSATPDGKTIFLGSDLSGLFRSLDGGESFEPSKTEANVHCIQSQGTDLWLCPGYVSTTYELGRSMNGGDDFESMLELDMFRNGNLVAAQCPGDALSALCESERPYVEMVLEQFDLLRPSEPSAPDAGTQVTDAGTASEPPDADEGPDTAKTSQKASDGCRAGSSPFRGEWGFLLAALVFRMRRQHVRGA